MDELNYWLAAIRLYAIGPATVCQWLENFSSLKEVFNANANSLKRAGLSDTHIRQIKNFNLSELDHELQWSKQAQQTILTLNDPRYPPQLKNIPAAPLVLYVQGDVELIQQTQLAIVGSRKPTKTGSETAKEFAKNLSGAGLVITSGMALGIDAASHRGALEFNGKTIAVMGTGLNYIYPTYHKKLAEQILQDGALVSEFPLNTPAKAENFPRRNRIISGLSLGVLVVEAALRSGSLITARYAAEQNRELFAIPGSIYNPLAKGCHALIRLGAKLTENTEDILEELVNIIPPSSLLPNPPIALAQKLSSNLSANYVEFLHQIGYEATSVDAVIARSGLTASQVSSMLLTLELQDYIQAVPGGYIRNPTKG